jgi:DNA-binding transcriptional ArsR family regulator
MTPAGIYEIQAEFCRILSNTIRLEIVHILSEGPKCVNEIAQATGQSQSWISRHLGALQKGGILTAQLHGQDIIYQIANPKIVNLCDLIREVVAEETFHRSQHVQGFSNEYSN